ncbi:hypothetical protein [Streptomyces sp. NPDC002889]|uniref:hypothetical protein n=1 Tax=Streptomyces sp. NPDC002889 TaxID=3364669 RepID=UPI00369CAA0E
MRQLRDTEKTTVFLTTHHLDEAEALCDRIQAIGHGAIVAEGTPDALALASVSYGPELALRSETAFQPPAQRGAPAAVPAVRVLIPVTEQLAPGRLHTLAASTRRPTSSMPNAPRSGVMWGPTSWSSMADCWSSELHSLLRGRASSRG